MGVGPIVLMNKFRSLLFNEQGKRTGFVEYGPPKDGQVYIFLVLGVSHPSEITPELIAGLVDHYRDAEWTAKGAKEPRP